MDLLGDLLSLDYGLLVLLLLLDLLLLPLLFLRFLLLLDFLLLKALSSSEVLKLLQFFLLANVLLFHRGGVAHPH